MEIDAIHNRHRPKTHRLSHRLSVSFLWTGQLLAGRSSGIVIRHRPTVTQAGHILSSEYIQVDESVIPVLDDEKHKARKGYEWCVRDGLTGNVMFYYDRGSRAGRVARELLSNYHGYVQTDGYEVYDEFEHRAGITNTFLRKKGMSSNAFCNGRPN